MRAHVLIDYVVDFLSRKPFSTKKAYQSYKDEMRRLSDEKIIEARSALASFKAQKSSREKNQRDLRHAYATEADQKLKRELKADMDEVVDRLGIVEKKIIDCKEVINGGKSKIVEYENFLEIMEKLPKHIKNFKNMSDLDYVIKKIFSNFTVKDKKVIESTLNEPFDRLQVKDVSLGGR